jgi:RHS repeat-associated protein
LPRPGSSLANIVLTAAYDASCPAGARVKCNNPNWTRDSAGQQTDFTYDATTGFGTSIKRPAATAGGIRPEIRTGYVPHQAYYKDASGAIVASGKPVTLATSSSSCRTKAVCTDTAANMADEIRVTVDYGQQTAGTPNNLLPVRITSGNGVGTVSATSAFTYDAMGNRTLIDGPLPGTADTMQTRYDAIRRVVGVVSPDPDGAGALKMRAQKITYNVDGDVTLTQSGTVDSRSDADWAAFNELQRVTNTYDANGRLTKSIGSAGGTDISLAQVNYDALGRTLCTAQRMDPTQWAGQSDACTPQTTGPNGPDRIVRNVYNALGQVERVQEAFGTPDQADAFVRTFTPNGQVRTEADGNGNLTTYELDGFGRVDRTRFPSVANGAVSSTTDYEQLTYNATGNVTKRRLRDAQEINFIYDLANRVTTKDVPNVTGVFDVSYTYDLLDRPLRAQDTSGGYVGYTYDALGRVVLEERGIGTKTMVYDLAGRMTRLGWPDGFFVNYDYLVTGEVARIRENGATTGIGVLASYLYDNLGNRKQVTRGNGATTAYNYDAASRLKYLGHNLTNAAQDVDTSFDYNPASQLAGFTRNNDAYAWNGHYNVDRPYTANGLNQLTSAGPVTLGYDARGNLTQSGATSFTYTAENRLAETGNVRLTYDPVGRLAQQAVGAPASATVTKFDYAGDQLITEYNGANVILRRYVHGPGTDEPLVWYEGADTGATTADRRWYHADERGSIVTLSNNAGAGMVVNTYDEFGIPGAANIGRFQYTGQTWMPEVGLYYYKARMYSPTLGRFMQTDPIGYGDGMNMYAYAGGDPVNGSDPEGKYMITVTAPRPPRVPSYVNVGLPRNNPTVVAANACLQNIQACVGGGRKPDNESECPEGSSGQSCSDIVVNGVRPKPPGPRPGIGHNGGPPLERSSMPPTGWNIIKGLLKAGALAGVIIDDVFFPDPAGLGSDKPLITDPSKSPVWNGLKPWRGHIKTDGNGHYYSYDRLHGEIEAYKANKKHIGVIDPWSGRLIGPAVRGRKGW